MRGVALLVACGVVLAQAPDPAYEPLSRAYGAFKARDYDGAVADFLKGIELAPGRASIRKGLGDTYLKIGENELAREQFQEALRLGPSDLLVAMEYAFLGYETGGRRRPGGSSIASGQQETKSRNRPSTTWTIR